jgi:hypothetical protein
MRLVYRSNFDLPDDRWGAETPNYGKCFRQGGYYHLQTANSGYSYNSLKIPLANFRLCFDAELVSSNKETDRYGVHFRDNKKGYYDFSVSQSGKYALWRVFDGEPNYIIYNRFSELIRRGNSTNSVMIEMVGQKISLGINGHILDTAEDYSIMDGYFGLYVSAEKTDSILEVRFRNFLLYAIEN